VGGRTSGQKYVYGVGDDGVRPKFASYERDVETGLDFLEARYYSSQQGRFTSPDPLYFQYSMAIDPQQFNLYGYVRNSPLKFTDPNGERLFAKGPSALDEFYKGVGGKAIFVQYFYVTDSGEVKSNPFADMSHANEGVRFLAGLVASPQIYLFYAGTDENEAASYFTNKEAARREFNGTRRGYKPGQGGSVTGTTGREAPEPAKLPTGEDVYFAMTINTNAVITQSSDLGENLRGMGTGTPFNKDILAALISGAGQQVQPISFFIHEAAEKQKFEEIGFTQPYSAQPNGRSNYGTAHNYGKEREAAIRRELGLTGGFAGGIITRHVPQR
jgi:RHS repeat-associated protein